MLPQELGCWRDGLGGNRGKIASCEQQATTASLQSPLQGCLLALRASLPAYCKQHCKLQALMLLQPCPAFACQCPVGTLSTDLQSHLCPCLSLVVVTRCLCFESAGHLSMAVFCRPEAGAIGVQALAPRIVHPQHQGNHSTRAQYSHKMEEPVGNHGDVTALPTGSYYWEQAVCCGCTAAECACSG